MTTTRKLIIAFWIFIVVTGLWECHSYNSGLNDEATQHPTQKAFFFYPPSTASAAPVSSHHADGADVQQTAFVIENNTPPGSFTCHVTLKNLGNAKATGIQIMVRPYRGVSNYDEDGGGQTPIVLTEDDPLSKLGEFVSFPDLAPGESATSDTSFINRTDFKPGKNPLPNILFHSEKASGAQPAATPAPPVPGGGG